MSNRYITSIIYMEYFKFANRLVPNRNDKESFCMWRFVLFFLKMFVPKANPDFDTLFKYVNTWFIEYDAGEQCVLREVGVDKYDKVIVKAPFKNNYGFWTDNNLTIKEFVTQFNIEYINKNDFEYVWNQL